MDDRGPAPDVTRAGATETAAADSEGEAGTQSFLETDRCSSGEQDTLPEDVSVGIQLGKYAAAQSTAQCGQCYLILFNLNKKNNLGTILRSAAAFGVQSVVLVGRRAFKSFCKKSGQGAVPIENAESVADAVALLRAKHLGERLHVCGVEIVPQATSLHEAPFHGHTAFMVGNERGGLTREQLDACDSLVYIPQFGARVGSLNVACACSIVLYQFSVWANAPGRGGLGMCPDPIPAMARPHGAGSFPVTAAPAASPLEHRKEVSRLPTAVAAAQEVEAAELPAG